MKKLFKSSVSLFLMLMFTLTIVTPAFAETSYYIMRIQSENGTVTLNNYGEAVDGGYKYPARTRVYLTAIPNTGYAFEHFIIEGKTYNKRMIGLSAPADQDFTVYAVFKKVSATLTIGTEGNGSINGVVSGTYNVGTAFTLTASPASDSTFSHWSLNGQLISSEPTYCFTLADNTVITGSFIPVVNETVVDSTIPATIISDPIVSDPVVLEPAAPDSAESAVSTPVKYTLDIVKTGNGAGEISPFDSNYDASTEVTLVALPDNNSNFTGWFIGDNLVSINPVYTFSINDNTILQAKFDLKQFILAVSMTGTGSGYISTYNIKNDILSNITLTATPNTESIFDGWYIGDTLLSSAQSYSFTIIADSLLQAKFKLKNNDVTSKLQLLGNPFTKAAYARNVWDMQIFNNSIYLGHGNSSNYAPVSNAGPIDVIKYDTATSTFVKEYTVNDEQIDTYKVIDNMLYIPGHDPKDAWTFGNYYKFDSSWSKVRTIPNAIHNYDMVKYNNKLYAATGINGTNPVVSSADDGNTWSSVVPTDSTKYSPSGLRTYSMFEYNGVLYAAGILTNYDPSSMNVLLSMNKDTVSAVKITGKKMFPGLTGANVIKIVKPTVVNNTLLYIAGKVNNDHQHIPLALYSSKEVGVGTKITFSEASAVPYDIIVRDSTTYVLASVKVAAYKYTNIVYSSTDLQTWTEKFRFTSDAFARSFEELNGDFYFGLGCDTVEMPESTGNILKVNKTDY